MTSAAFTVGVVQAALGLDVARNRAKLLDSVREAADRGAHVVVLPELFSAPYFCQVEDPGLRDLARPLDGADLAALSAAARRSEVVVVTSLYEDAGDGRRFNTAVVLDGDGSLAGTYRKVHVPSDTVYREAFYFDPGDMGFPVHATRWGAIGVGICWDQWFPEAARSLALGGADLLVYPTAVGWVDGEPGVGEAAERDAWSVVQRGSAVANGVHVAAANRVGRDGAIRFWGGSFVSGPMGQVLAEGSVGEEVLLAEVRRSDREAARADWPFLAARRPAAYAR